MQNVTVKTEGTKLILTVDLSERHGPSASGKTIIIGTTEGNQSIALPDGKGTASFGLNVYTRTSPAPGYTSR